MTSRDRRRALIKRLVQEHRISSQDELARLLEVEGVEVTQATLSRDLRDLSISRKNTADGPVYQLDRKAIYIEALRRVVGMEILDVRSNGTLIVIRTLSGRAEGVAGFLDSWGNSKILGTVAGDDTVFVAPVDSDCVRELVDEIRALEVSADEP